MAEREAVNVMTAFARNRNRMAKHRHGARFVEQTAGAPVERYSFGNKEPNVTGMIQPA